MTRLIVQSALLAAFGTAMYALRNNTGGSQMLVVGGAFFVFALLLGLLLAAWRSF